MSDHDKPSTDVPDRHDERLWETARAAFLDRYSRTPNVTPDEVAKWAVDGALALCKEFRRKAFQPDKTRKQRL